MTSPLYTLDQWRRAAADQPPLPSQIPPWLRDFATAARQGNIHDRLNEPARIVPETGPDGTPPRYSAVLLLIGGPKGFDPTPEQPFPPEATLLLTHRAPTMRNHSGQMAFPGGRWEPQDAGPVETALREAEEETGLDTSGVEPLAVLQPVYIDRSNFAVIPVLAYWARPGKVHPASPENDWVQAYPLRRLVDPRLRYTVGFAGWSGPAFDVEGMVLWGFTAGVLTAVLQVAGWEQSWAAEPTRDLLEVLRKSANKEALAHMAAKFRAAGETGGAP
ncbi:NUDIX hydrolase [Corynebacterium heidelbergense]|uniref:CoA pyrophosphatase n=1 Tax=Corynebacterium heidelbergense TaxID=2055947 RepID=A0A364V9G7_9CORY|nr:CoA pyrophosphatase [Corynebacterium heidelbergense]RAV33302.1 CoA pyrophosphatase [Corynebacterium heidelbergense]WCZ37482.1 putative NUDIX hydrolase [Corynebacterium heidelbergense]